MSERETVLNQVARLGGRTTVRGFQKRFHVPTAAAAEASLGSLVAAGLARWEKATPRPAGGWPMLWCVLTVDPPVVPRRFREDV
jgi:hypothetical protein